MKKILVLATGGTIASGDGENGLKPQFGIESIFSYITGIQDRYDITVKDILQLDSSNIQPEEWHIIALSIHLQYKDYDGVVITHGTDTMAYTASMLSYMLQNIPIPIVLTGSQLPMIHPLTDAAENMRSAFAMADSGIGGVFLAFNRKIIMGTRAVKIRTSGFDAFESVNCPYVAKIDASGLRIRENGFIKNKGHFQLKDHICSNVLLLKLFPGMNPMIFDKMLELQCKGLVIEAFGAGGMHFVRRNLVSKIQKMIDHGVPVVVCSQCLYEKSDFSIYEAGRKVVAVGAIEGKDMTTEAAITKLMWALGQTEDMDEIRSIFAKNLAGEIML